MKKSIKISLGGISFHIEDDAYEALESYIFSLKRHLKDTPEAQEIVNDIEERAAELFTEMLDGKENITIDMVKSMMATLGSPEQITNEEVNDNEEPTNSTRETKRRLYRDGDNAIIAGVCSGLGEYFKIDPLVLRIIMFVLIFANGLGLIIYLVIWIAVPRAETVRQRMEMRGEEINFSNLEKNVKNEFEEVKKNMEKHRISGFFESIFSAVGSIFIAIGRLLGGVAKVLAVIIAVVFISIGLVGLLGTISSFFLGAFITNLIPAYSGFTINGLLSTTIDLASTLWVTIPMFFILAIPFLAFIYLGIRMVFKFKARDSIFFVSAATLWIVAVTLLAFVLFFQARSFTIRESVKEKTELYAPAESSTAIRIIAGQDYTPDDIYPDRIVTIDDYTIAYSDGKTTIVGKPRVFIGKSNSDNYELIIVKKSRGATKQLAIASAERVVLNYSLMESNLIINPFFFLPNQEKWRAQDVEITINVPNGRQIFIDRSMETILGDEQEYCFCWPDEMVGKTWIMKGDRLVEL
jgi:phage shock protein PspC (stress-responsive transcriptional regulator)